jgi:hypothetical protein
MKGRMKDVNWPFNVDVKFQDFKLEQESVSVLVH